jgi:hypothetical protein
MREYDGARFWLHVESYRYLREEGGDELRGSVGGGRQNNPGRNKNLTSILTIFLLFPGERGTLVPCFVHLRQFLHDLEWGLSSSVESFG